MRWAAFRLNSSTGKCYPPSIAFQPDAIFIAVFYGTDASTNWIPSAAAFSGMCRRAKAGASETTMSGTFSDTPVEVPQDEPPEYWSITEQVRS